MQRVGIRRLALFAAILSGWCASADAVDVELAGVVQLDARSFHACALTAGGGVKCWGWNDSGQLGIGSSGSSHLPNAADVVGLGSGAASIATSTGSHTCAVMNAGGVKCWGANGSGQLGDGTTTNRPTPVDVQGLPWPAVAVTAGHAHTCAMSGSGAVACWGGNSAGQIGDGTFDARPTPTLAGVLGAVAISAAVNHTCAIVAGGAVKCWGSNSMGQLGDGTTVTRSTPVDVIGVTGATQLTTSGNVGFRSITPLTTWDVGKSCAVVGGVVKCWSDLGLTEEHFDAGVTQVSRGGATLRFTTCCSAALDHTCAVTADGRVQCSGSNYCGMVDGKGSCGLFGYPYLPPTTVVGVPSGIVSVSAASTMTCALMASGRVTCWGTGAGSPGVIAMAPVLVEGTNPQVISFSTPLSLPVGGTGPLVLQGAGQSGNTVTFTSLTPSTCSVSNGVTGIAPGTCTIAANQAGSTYYDPAPQATRSFPIDPRLTQAITFGPMPSLAVNTVAAVTATASSGLPVTLTADGVNCALAGSLVIGLRETTGPFFSPCIITATQAGDSTYAPAPPSESGIQVTANGGALGLMVYKSGGGTGTVASSTAGIDCGPACAANFPASSTVTLTANAAFGSHFAGWSGACTGMDACVVTMDALKTVHARFASAIPRPVNISTRGFVGTGNDVLIGGFVIGGSVNKRVAIVATGPSLSAFGVSNPLSDPKLTLMRSADQALILTNDDWRQGSNAIELEALGLAPANDLEAAILLDLAPGAYTAIAEGTGNGTGVALVGVYEIAAANAPLVNISTRGRVGIGDDVMIGGFVIGGAAPQKLAIVGTGPSLTAFGLDGVLPNPVLTLVRSSDQAVLATNDDWGTAANAPELQAAGFAPSNPLESAILVTLPPGAYTAILSGTPGNVGVGVIGVYKVD